MCRAAVECLVNNTFAVSPRPNLHHHRHHGRTTMLHRVADSDGTIAMPYHPMPYPCHTISYRLPGEAFGFRLSTLSGWNRNRNHTVLRVYYILYAVFPCSQKPTAGEAKWSEVPGRPPLCQSFRRAVLWQPWQAPKQQPKKIQKKGGKTKAETKMKTKWDEMSWVESRWKRDTCSHPHHTHMQPFKIPPCGRFDF